MARNVFLARGVRAPWAGTRGAVALAAAALALLLLLVAPASAQADCGVSVTLDLDMAGCMTDAIKGVGDSLFSGWTTDLSLGMITYLVQIPNFTGDPEVQHLVSLTTAMAFGALGAVLSIAVLRYWLSGLSLSGAGGVEAAEGLMRTVLAVLMILAWPWFFKNGTNLFNTATQAVIGDPGVQASLKDMFLEMKIEFFMPGPLWLLGLINGLANAFALFGLLLIKLGITGGTVFVFCGGPIGIVLLPLEDLAYFTKTFFKVMLYCWFVPFIWTLLFASYAALGTGLFQPPTGGGFSGMADQLMRPLASTALLLAAIKIPSKMLTAAFNPAGSGGGMGKMAALLVARALLGGGGGGGKSASTTVPASPGGDPLAETMERVNPAFALPAGPSAGPKESWPKPPPAPPSGNPPGEKPPPGSGPHGQPQGPGHPTEPSFDKFLATSLVDRMGRVDRTGKRADKPTKGDVTAAQSRLDPADQQRLWNAKEQTGNRVRPLAAQMAAEYGRSPQSMMDLWTIGLADPAARAAGMYDPSKPKPEPTSKSKSQPQPQPTPSSQPPTGASAGPGGGAGMGGGGGSPGAGSATPPQRSAVDMVETSPGSGVFVGPANVGTQYAQSSSSPIDVAETRPRTEPGTFEATGNPSPGVDAAAWRPTAGPSSEPADAEIVPDPPAKKRD
jgi:hypothetical protein